MRYLRPGVIRTIVPSLVLILASSLPANAIIYGADDRMDLYDVTPNQQAAAGAVFVVVNSMAMDESDPTDIVLFGSPSYKQIITGRSCNTGLFN